MEKKSKFIFWLGLIVVLCFVYALVPPQYSFYGDSLIKLLMAQSLLLRDFQSINYFYFFENFDPHFTYFPVDYSLYHLQKENLHFGPFGFSFSFFYAILLKIFPYSFLPIFSAIILVLIVLHLRKNWNLDYFSLGFLVFCTSLFIYVVEFSENIFFIAFHFLSLSFFLKEKKGLAWDSFLASLFLVISISFRLEALMYFGFFVPTYIYIQRKNINFKNLFLFLGFSFLFLSLFFFLNYKIYGHILGGKYLADEQNFFIISQKFFNYVSLWIGVKEEMFFKPGFFGLTPFFIVIIYFGVKYIKNLSQSSQVLLISSLLYILFAPLFSPHDGHWSWGARYLNIVVLPLGIILHEFNLLKSFWNSSVWKRIVLILLLLISCVQVFLGIFIISISCKVMKQVQEATLKVDSNFRLFENGILALHTGPQLLSTPSLLVKNQEDLEKLILILKNFPNQTIAFISSKKLETLLSKGNISFSLKEETIIQSLTKHFEFLGEEKNEFISIRRYLISQ